ncbi:MAG: hypothetical protein CEE38_19655 [Planctomycetes bacterium B3_Pla]|nr:MAG: hypothetical protein CEE38_19655 [Planctomycetes bacterium B3_Pla]
MFRRATFLACLSLALLSAGNARADLVGHWRLDGSAADSSGSGLDGEIIGSPNWVDGKVGEAMEIDGDDWIEIPGTSQNDGFPSVEGEVSWAVWFKTSNAGVLNTVMAMGPAGAAHVQGNRSINIETSGVIMIRAHSVGALTSLSSTAAVNDGEWHHVAVTIAFDTDGANDSMKVYIDGDLASGYETDAVNVNQHSGPGAGFILALGARGSTPFVGLIDDARVYDHVLTEDEILAAMLGGGGGNPLAVGPNPGDGELYENTWANLGWRPGYYAVSHDLYFGTSFDDVNDGAEGTFVGNLATTSQVVGFPGFPASDGLQPGTTYYWRVDEVNDANAASPWKGNVWSFWVPPKIAYEPDPADGAKFVLSDVTLGWTPGFGTKLHHVYFGDNPDEVGSAAGALPQTDATLTPATLELEKTYYWRVDEFDGANTYKGDVWSFTTIPVIAVHEDPNLVGWWTLDEGMGNTALDWSGHGNHGTMQGDLQWVNGYDGGALEFDGSGDDIVEAAGFEGVTGTQSRTVTAWIRTSALGEIASWGQNVAGQKWIFRVQNSNGQAGAIRIEVNGGYQVGSTDMRDGIWHHVAAVLVDDGSPDVMEITLYVDSQQEVISAQLDEPIDTAAGVVRIGQAPWGSRPFNGQIDDVRIYDKALTQEEVQLVMRIDPLSAWNSSPANGSTPDIDSATPLNWSPGDSASSHEVYFGADKDAVKNADTSDTTGIYRGSQSGTTFTPAEGVEWGAGPFYWRIDENNTDGTVTTGRVWTFTVADFILVDDFEGYTDNDAENEAIWQHWIDGFGVPTNGSQVGYVMPPYAEQTIVNGGLKSMPLSYNNTAGVTNSQAELTLTAPRDWTVHGVSVLSLWFRGYPPSVGSFTEGPVGTFTMTGSGADIWGTADQFHFAYKTLTGPGTIIARINSVQNTHGWAKAGVMIRETLDAGSKHAFVCVTPDNGVVSQGRTDTDIASFSTNETGITAPRWVRLERDAVGNLTASHSSNGTAWQPVGNAFPENIPMEGTIYVGLALTSHDDDQTCEAVFSDVTITGTVGQQWTNQDIGIVGNSAEPLYVALSNSTGTPAVVVHDDPGAATIDVWTEWSIDLSKFADQGVNLADIDKIALGLGTVGNAAASGGSGTLFVDDIRLLRPALEEPPAN